MDYIIHILAGVAALSFIFIIGCMCYMVGAIGNPLGIAFMLLFVCVLGALVLDANK